MEALSYLAVLAACLAITLPLEFVFRARVYRRPGLVAVTLAPVVLGFGVWDVLATARGHWWFADRYVLGVRLLGLPIEEWLFFIVVPLCALLTYEALGSGRIHWPARVRGARRSAAGGDRDA